jgi:hypothetical protein
VVKHQILTTVIIVILVDVSIISSFSEMNEGKPFQIAYGQPLPPNIPTIRCQYYELPCLYIQANWVSPTSYYHSYFIFENENREKFFIRGGGGPSGFGRGDCGLPPLLGIWIISGPYVPGTIDYRTDYDSIGWRLLSGEDAREKWRYLLAAERHINYASQCVPYAFSGPNSNTAARALAELSGLTYTVTEPHPGGFVGLTLQDVVQRGLIGDVLGWNHPLPSDWNPPLRVLVSPPPGSPLPPRPPGSREP